MWAPGLTGTMTGVRQPELGEDITPGSREGQQDDKSDGMSGLGDSSHVSFCPFV